MSRTENRDASKETTMTTSQRNALTKMNERNTGAVATSVGWVFPQGIRDDERKAAAVLVAFAKPWPNGCGRDVQVSGGEWSILDAWRGQPARARFDAGGERYPDAYGEGATAEDAILNARPVER